MINMSDMPLELNRVLQPLLLLLTNFDGGNPQSAVLQQHAYAAGCDSFS